jgi:hypothetical protein
MAYSDGGNFKEGSYASFSVGNLGASSTKCASLELTAE